MVGLKEAGLMHSLMKAEGIRLLARLISLEARTPGFFGKDSESYMLQKTTLDIVQSLWSLFSVPKAGSQASKRGRKVGELSCLTAFPGQSSVAASYSLCPIMLLDAHFGGLVKAPPWLLWDLKAVERRGIGLDEGLQSPTECIPSTNQNSSLPANQPMGFRKPHA